MSTSNETKVIQCPSCQTKFAVMENQLAGSSFPRFHCSRCDHVFSVEQQVEIPLSPVEDPIREEAGLAAPTMQNDAESFPSPQASSNWMLGEEPVTEAPHEAPKAVTDNVFSTDQPSAFEPEVAHEAPHEDEFIEDMNPPYIKPEDISNPPVMNFDSFQQQDSESFEESEPHQSYTIQEEPEHVASNPTLFSEPAFSEPANVEIPPLEEILDDSSDPEPEEDTEPGVSVESTLSINEMSSDKTAEMPAAVRTEALQQMDMVLNPRAMRPVHNKPAPAESFDPEPQIVEEEVTDTLDFSKPAGDKQRSIWGKKPAKKDGDWDTTAPVEDELVAETFAAKHPPKPSRRALGRWKSVAAISAPLLVFLGVLFLAGFILSQNPKNAWAVSSTITGSRTQIAPPDLHMTSIGHSVVELESGDVVHVIEGTLQNNTDDTFKAIKLEAFTFNAAGKTLASSIVSANSSLGRTRIQSLTLPMIQNLQSTERNGRFALKPGQEFDFTIALAQAPDHAVDYYSARVYSIQ